MMEPALDRGMFRTVMQCIAIRVANKDVFATQKAIGRGRMLSIRTIKNIVNDGSTHKLLLLAQNEDKDESITTALDGINFEKKEHTVEIKYENLQADEVLRKLLPENVEVPSGFETVGHIAHLNLRPEHEPYKRRIAQVILDKTGNVETVVNKTGIIETQFRTFPMEVLAGKDDMNVDVKMNGLRFKFNFAKVYWNSRLSEEHERLVKNRFKAGDLVIDGFCGVGPFAVRAAKLGCAVQANDLNPESVASVLENAAINKLPVKDQRQVNLSSEELPIPPENGVIHAYNGDAREFLRFVLKGLPPKVQSHIVMNLPATAPEFLDSLIGAVPNQSILPKVHCYCFTTAKSTDDRKVDVTSRIRHILAINRPDFDIEVRDVRDVAPNKYMVCAHFVLPDDTAYKGDANSVPSKKLKQSESN